MSSQPNGTPPPALDQSSGDVSVPVLELRAGGRVAAAPAWVTGRAFHGQLAKLQGARVSASPVIYTDMTKSPPAKAPATPKDRAFIVDFGRSVSVLGLELTVSGKITLVLPWLGIDFSATPAFTSTTGAESAGLSGVETTKLLVQVTDVTVEAGALPGSLLITTLTFPENVRASLNGRLPFWSHPGRLDRKVELTGMVDDLNALAASATEDPIAVSLALSSDAPGVLFVELGEGFEVDRAAEARWGGQGRLDVALGALERHPLTVPFPSDSDADWALRRVIVEASGSFPPWRAYPAQATAEAGNLGLRVDATFSAARRLEVRSDAELHGVALALRAPLAPCELHVEVKADAGGAPDPGDPIASGGLLLAPVDGAAPVGWHEVLFATPVTLAAASGGWLVLQAKTGAAEWVAAAEPAAPAVRTLGTAQGGRWDSYPPPRSGTVVVALARILRRPFATENDALVELAWADSPEHRVTFDPGGGASTIVLTRPDPDPGPLPASAASGHTIDLTAVAGASGTLTLQRVTTLYREAGP